MTAKERLAYDLGFHEGKTAALDSIVRCKDCKHLNVVNRKELYAYCPKTNTPFLSFKLDTREHFCSCGEMNGGIEDGV